MFGAAVLLSGREYHFQSRWAQSYQTFVVISDIKSGFSLPCPLYRVASRVQRLSPCVESVCVLKGRVAVGTFDILLLSKFPMVFISQNLYAAMFLIHRHSPDTSKLCDLAWVQGAGNGTVICSSISCWSSGDLSMKPLPWASQDTTMSL